MKPELIAPASDMDCVRAAVANGADAVYFGLPRFNARMRAGHFTAEELPSLVRFLHDRHVRAFVTLNTLVFTNELAEMQTQLIQIEEAGADAVIVQDLGVAWLARELKLRLPVFGSTQMTVTSPEGARWVARLGIRQVVLARELSLEQLATFKGTDLPAREVFIHGALCISFSGQCLASLAIGDRSGNRGECAQPCRLPYDLAVDGQSQDLGSRRYLLSPQDLAGIREIPELIHLGVAGFKIEGRMKSAEYVAATARVYRKVLDAALAGKPCDPASPDDLYELQMAFSRGLCSGWLRGVNHRELVHGRFGKNRGAPVGQVRRVGKDRVEVDFAAGAEERLQPGDGLVFETGGDPEQEQGGHVYERKGDRLFFGNNRIDFSRIKVGDRIWKTSDPRMEREWRKSYASEIPLPKIPVDLRVMGRAGEPLGLETTVGARTYRVHSKGLLQVAHKQPLTTERLREQLGRLGDTRFQLGQLHNKLEGGVILPVSQLNALRRELVVRMESDRPDGTKAGAPELEGGASSPPHGGCGRAAARPYLLSGPSLQDTEPRPPIEWTVLCRTLEQVAAAMEAGGRMLYVDLENLDLYPQAVQQVRKSAQAHILLATPRIQMPGEEHVFKAVEDARPDGVLIRNLGALEYFRKSPLKKVGDFSLNVTNPLSAAVLIEAGLTRVTLAPDLREETLLDLLRAAPPQWFELVVYQHLPMFHTAHCLYVANESRGTDASNCGRPCQGHALRLRDRKGVEHPVRRDAFCRNTVFQQSVRKVGEWEKHLAAGLRFFRIELLDENTKETGALVGRMRR